MVLGIFVRLFSNVRSVIQKEALAQHWPRSSWGSEDVTRVSSLQYRLLTSNHNYHQRTATGMGRLGGCIQCFNLEGHHHPRNKTWAFPNKSANGLPTPSDGPVGFDLHLGVVTDKVRTPWPSKFLEKRHKQDTRKLGALFEIGLETGVCLFGPPTK